MPRFRVAIPAVVAVDIEAKDAEEALQQAEDTRLTIYQMAEEPIVSGRQLAWFGENAALWAAGCYSGKGKTAPELWDEDTNEPIDPSDPRHPSYDGPSDEDRERMAERMDYAREAQREQLRDAGRPW